MGQAFATPRGRKGRLAQLLAFGGVIGRAQHDVERADHDGQQVVEIVGHTAGKATDRLHPLCMHQIGLCPGLFRQGLTDPLLEQIVDPLEVLFRALGVGHIDVGTDKALEHIGRVEPGSALAPQPARSQFRMFDREHPLVAFTLQHGLFEGEVGFLEVEGLDRHAPVRLLAFWDPEKGLVGLVDEDELADGVRHPDLHRGAVGDQAKPAFALVDAGGGPAQVFEGAVKRPHLVTQGRCNGDDEEADDKEIDRGHDPGPVHEPGIDRVETHHGPSTEQAGQQGGDASHPARRQRGDDHRRQQDHEAGVAAVESTQCGTDDQSGRRRPDPDQQ